MTTVAPLPPAIPAGPAPSLSPSRKRRLSLKSLVAPFRRSERNEPPLPSGATSRNAYNPLDHPNDPQSPPTRPRSKASSIFSKKLRRKSLVNLGKAGKGQKEGEKGNTDEIPEMLRSTINWQKRTRDEPLPSEAANIRAAWLHQQHRLETQYPPQISIELDPRGSLGSVGSLLFPTSSQGQNLQVFVSPAPTSPGQGNYSTYAPSTASSQRDDLLRTMAQPFPSRPPSQISGPRRQSLSMTTATPENESLPFMFPVPPPRQSDLPTPPASPYGPASGPPALGPEIVVKPGQHQPMPLDTPPHTPQRTSYHEAGDRAASSTPARQNSLVSAVDFASTSPANPRRPLSLSLSQASGTIPIFTRGNSPFNRFGHNRSASAALPSNSSSTSAISNAGSTTRRPVSIAPQLGGRRMSASLASSGAFAGGPPGGSNRQSWASMQSQASSIGSSASATGTTNSSAGRNLVDEVRRRADERERRNNSRAMHRRVDSNATVVQDKRQSWCPSEADILEKENVALRESPLRDGASAQDGSSEHYGAEAEALMGDMFSDERMQALVRELGI